MNTQIPALSIRQPFVWAILYAGKDIENRTWGARYRGRVRLHASQSWDADGEACLAHRGLIVPNYFVCRDKGWLGAYLGEVTLTNCVGYDTAFAAAENPWAFGPVCWVLKDALAYPEPIPGRGYPGLYYPERFTKRDRPPEKRRALG